MFEPPYVGCYQIAGPNPKVFGDLVFGVFNGHWSFKGRPSASVVIVLPTRIRMPSISPQM
jgi:hypothetical protein